MYFFLLYGQSYVKVIFYSFYKEGETMMHLKVVEVWQEIPPARDHDVPVFIKPLEHGLNWDLTTTQVLHIYFLRFIFVLDFFQ